MKRLISVLLVLCMMFACLAAVAEDAAEDAAEPQQAPVFETADGVLNIQAPNETWVEIPDPDFWFAMTDGDDYILISHLSNGEALPAMMVANDEFAAVYDACVSTTNEVFHITGCATDKESLKDIMEAISTIRILKFDTKQAIQKAVVPVTEFMVDDYNDVLYCTSKQLNVRSSWGVKSPRLGYLRKGQQVEVTGIVRRNGRDYGWYRINYNGRDAYVSAKYLSATKPSGSSRQNRENPPDLDTQDPLAGYVANAPELYEDPPDLDTQDPLAGQFTNP